MGQRVDEALRSAAMLFADRTQARLDAELLLAHVLDKSRSWLHAWPERQLSDEQAAAFARLTAARADGQPLAYLIGRREFWSLSLEVNRDTLIPRPETEHLVETALAQLPPDRPLRVLDAGTGSGAIALALARERPCWHLIALDRSLRALAVAKRNAERLGVANMSLVAADWGAAFGAASLDALISNPPYVAARDPHLRRGDLRFEPHSALISGADGVDDIRRIAADAPRVLKAGAPLILEHGPDQAEAVTGLLQHNQFTDIQCLADLAGLARVTLAVKRR